jgi:hypothetical protein
VPELDGHVYTGDFLNGARHGRGEMVWCKGVCLKYNGQWEVDKHNGQGDMLYRSGERVCGSWWPCARGSSLWDGDRGWCSQWLLVLLQLVGRHHVLWVLAGQRVSWCWYP